jgi:hypothetical protein
VNVSLSVSRTHQPAEVVFVHVRVVNDSEHGVTVEQVCILGTEAEGWEAVEFVGSELQQRTISAHDGFSAASALAPGFLDWSKPMVAQVLLASNLWFQSESASPPSPSEALGAETAVMVPWDSVRG